MEDRRIFDHQPLPLARAYRRWRNAAEPREAHDAAYYLFEVYLKFAAAAAIARYLAGAERDHKVNAVLKGLALPSLGEWLRFLRECLSFLAAEGAPDPAALALRDLLQARSPRWKEALALHNALRAHREGKPSAKETLSLEELLNEVVAYRNRVLGHGAPLEREHYAQFGPRFARAFEEILEASTFLTARRLVSFDSVQVESDAGAGRPRIECRTIEFMGLQPLRREKPLVLEYGAEPPRKNCLYLLADESALLCLDPLLIAHGEDVLLLNDAQGGLEYLSYSSGERHRPRHMESAQGDLFERILGYRPDPARLSHLGDDLAQATAEGDPTAAAGAAAEPGPERIGDYRIIREIGRGGMGAVFEAFQESLGRRVALKILPGTFALDQRRLERFRREARATARIHHPSIVPVYEVGESRGTHYYSMEYVEGASLDGLLALARKEAEARQGRKKGSSTSSPAAVTQAAERMAELAEGLSEAHKLGLIHRDVKPSNIRVEPSGRYVLVDFGLVHDVEAQTLTRSGEMVGTLHYMSPEQVSKGPVDARADVYSLGVTLYEVLTLRAPFEGQSDHDVHRAILFEEPVPPRKLNPRIHRDLETIVLHALEKNPERRYPSAAAMAKDLRRFLRHEPIQAKPQSALTRLGKRAWKHRLPVAAASVVAALLLVVGFFFLRSEREARLRRESSYGPQVLAAVMKIERGQISQRAAGGQSALGGIGWWSEVLRQTGVNPIDEAIEELGRCIESQPQRVDAYFHRARARSLGDQKSHALEDLDRAAGIDARFVPALSLAAAIHQQLGHAEQTEAFRSRALAAADRGWQASWLKANDALENGKWKDAEAAFSEIIALESEGGEPYLGSSLFIRIGRGRARLESGDPLGAIADFGVAEDRWPQALEPVLFTGKAYCILGKKANAETLFKKLHQSAPPALEDEVALAVSEIYASFEPEMQLEWAKQVKREVLKESAQIWPLWNLGRTAEAVNAGKHAIDLAPTFVNPYFSLAGVYSHMGNYAEAQRVAMEAIRIQPKSAAAHCALAFAYWFNGRAHEAIQQYKEVLRLDPREFSGHTYQAINCANLGLSEEALQHFADAKRLYPLEAEIPWLLGNALRNLGRQEEALREYDLSIRLSPNFSWAISAKAGVLEGMGKIEEAKQLYLKARPLFPVVPGIPNELGRFHAAEGKFREAMAEHLEAIKRNGGPSHSDSYQFVLNLLQRSDASFSAVDLDRIISALETARKEYGDHPTLLRALVFAHLQHPEKKNLSPVVELVRAALDRTEGKDQDLIRVLAEALRLEKKTEQAIEVLERAIREPNVTIEVRDLLRACGRELSPRLITPALIDDALAIPRTEPLLPAGARWRYFPGTSEPSEGLLWTRSDFPDQSWKEGPSGFGYGDNDDATVLKDMESSYTTLYIRRKFTLPDVSRYRRVLLTVIVDDGFVAYLNGVEVGRVRASGVGKRLDCDVVADASAPEPLIPVQISIDPARLIHRENVLAIQGLNTSKASSDFSLIPTLDGELPRDPAKAEALVEALRSIPEKGEALAAYCEGSLLAEAGRHREAAEKLAKALELGLRQPEAHLKLAGALRAGGDIAGAERALRRGVEQYPEDRDLWDPWSALVMLDPARDPKEVQKSIPASISSHADDLCWLLERLGAGESIRINCGGPDYQAKDGRWWSRDRFYLCGLPQGENSGEPWSYTLPIEKTEDDPLYQIGRYFFPESARPAGYRIPLPPGAYRVTLHFAEFRTAWPGGRAFGVKLESKDFLQEHEPLKAGFATADWKSFDVPVTDGLLDIEFTRWTGNPFVFAIEVQRTAAAP